MGNLALMKCCAGVAFVRVVRVNGRIDDFDVPVTALEVMQRYPQNLVIHSNYIDREASSEQQRRKITVVRPESNLLPGQEYILYPIPPQYRETVAHSFAKQMVSLNLDEEQRPKQPVARKFSPRSQIIGATRQHLATILQTSKDSIKYGDEGRDSSGSSRCRSAEKRIKGLESSKVEDEGDVDNDVADDFSFCYSASWKPSLHSIPESRILPDPAHVRRHSFSSILESH